MSKLFLLYRSFRRVHRSFMRRLGVNRDSDLYRGIFYILLLITLCVSAVFAMEEKIPGASYYTVHRKGGVCNRYRMPGVFCACKCSEHSDKIVQLLKRGVPAVSYHNQKHEIIQVEQGTGDGSHKKLDPNAKPLVVRAVIKYESAEGPQIHFYDAAGVCLGYALYPDALDAKKEKIVEKFSSNYLSISPDLEIKDTYYQYLMRKAKKGVSWLWSKVSQ